MSQYITPGETVKLYGYSYPSQSEAAVDIYKAFVEDRLSKFHYVESISTICAVFNAGRIAGIREERAKRKKVKQ